MEVNGLQLPAALVQILHDANGETTGWMLKDPDWRKQVNAYGDEFSLGDFMILDYDTMVGETDDLPGRFDPSWEKFYYDRAKEPGSTPLNRGGGKSRKKGVQGRTRIVRKRSRSPTHATRWHVL
jgi:hypothetical protein